MLRKNKQGAFTLVELLVVISIIALLLAVLMPSLSKARKSAASIVCRSRMKQLTLAWSMYAAANDERLVFSGTRSGGTLCQDPDDPRYGKILMPWAVNFDRVGIEDGALWPYIKDVEVYRCPSDKRCRIAEGTRNEQWRTYSLSDLMAGDYFSNGQNNADGNDAKRRYFKTVNIKRPSDRLVFIEEGAKFPNSTTTPFLNSGGSWAMNPTKRKWVDAVWTEHGSAQEAACMMSFADGHVDRFVLDRISTQIMNEREGNPADHPKNDERNSGSLKKMLNYYSKY